MTVYRGFDVYDGFLYDQGGAVKEQLSRVARTVENPAGRFVVQHDAPVPKRQQSGLLLWCDSRAAVTALDTFLGNRLGRYSPFWLPSWTADMELVSEALDGDGRRVLTVRTSLLSRSRVHSESARDLVGITAAGAFVGPARIVNAVDNGDGTEAITLDDASGASWVAVVMISWMRFVRLSSDEIERKWFAPDRCTVTLDVTDAWDATPALPPDPVPTVLYWRNIAAAAAPAGRRSGKAVISGDFLSPAGSLLTTQGTSVSVGFPFPGSGAEPGGGSIATGFLPGRAFASPPLKAQTIQAQPWVFGGAAIDRSGQFTGFAAALYVWRPSDDSVQMLYDGASIIGSPWQFAAVTGAIGILDCPLVTVLDGDLLMLEVYQSIEPGGTAWEVPAGANYDGSSPIVDGQSVIINPAAFLRSTYTLRFL
ncbi:MAG TPA: hypothetical protein VFK04_12995 [Gemmatimonadaceae bacterium]|nr:hypothetical protein [Gemmatimonadaceae bacterium]